jgi:hypothetical protein
LGAQNVNGRPQNQTDGFHGEVSHAPLKEGNEFLDSIVVGDETGVFDNTPELEQQSLQWQKAVTFKGQAADFYNSDTECGSKT